MKEELLRMERVVKKGSGQDELDGFNLNIYKGEVVLVLGIHDSGQQTLVDVLSGKKQIDSGTVFFDEERVALDSMDKARSLGIYSVIEDTRLVSDLTVAENIFAIRRSKRRRFIMRRGVMEKQARSILETINMDIPPDTVATQLTVADQHLIEIAKDVAMGAKLIVNDDLRLPYTHMELERLKRVVRQYVKQGVSFLIASSSSEELGSVFDLADRIVVIRDGQDIRVLHEEEFDPDYLVSLMVGRDFRFSYSRHKAVTSNAVLRVEHLYSDTGLQDISFAVNAGEIVGLLDLNRRANLEIAEILTGSGSDYTGAIKLDNQIVRFNNICKAIKNGIALIPEYSMDNQLPDCMTAAENLSLPLLRGRRHTPVLKNDAMLKAVLKENSGELGLLPDVCDTTISSLPPPVRLRLLYLRWILSKPRLLVCIKPITPLDIVMKDVAYSMLDKAANAGIGVLIISSDPAEVAAICDKIIVLSGGCVKAVLNNDQFSSKDVIKY